MNVSEIVDMQRKLVSFVGVSGREQDVANFILSEIKKYTDKSWIDPLGSVLAIIEGNDKSKTRVLIDAHMDEIGFIISHITNDGFLKFSPMGGIDKRLYPGTRVIIKNIKNEHITGIIGLPPVHLTSATDREKVLPVTSYSIDIGAKDAKEVQDLGIDVGSTGVLDTPFEYIKDRGILRGRAFDDRTGCNVLLQVAKLLSQSNQRNNTILFSFTIGEEVGGRGAKPAAFTLEPDYIIAIENTIAADVPGVSPDVCPTSLDHGPAITVADGSLVCDERLIDLLKKTSEKLNINWQYKKPIFGGTNAGVMHTVNKGIPASVLSVPCRYIHSPLSQLKIKDLEDTITVLYNAIVNEFPF